MAQPRSQSAETADPTVDCSRTGLSLCLHLLSGLWLGLIDSRRSNPALRQIRRLFSKTTSLVGDWGVGQPDWKILTAPLHFECHFGVDAITCDLASFNRSSEFLYVDRTNVAQCLGGFARHILGRIFPTFRRFRHHLDDFDDFCHKFGSFPCLYRGREWSRLLFSRIEPLARSRRAKAARLGVFQITRPSGHRDASDRARH